MIRPSRGVEGSYTLGANTGGAVTEPTQRRSQPKPKMTPKKVGELLGLRPAYVLDLARRDELPHVRIGRYTRFDEAD